MVGIQLTRSAKAPALRHNVDRAEIPLEHFQRVRDFRRMSHLCKEQHQSDCCCTFQKPSQNKIPDHEQPPERTPSCELAETTVTCLFEIQLPPGHTFILVPGRAENRF